jgi:hypothetical protein
MTERDEIHAFAGAMLAHLGEVNPYSLDGRPLDIAGIVAMAVDRFGPEAVQALHHFRVTLH